MDDPDSSSQNVVLRAIQTPTVTDTPVKVTNPWNTDPLDLDWDANACKALQVMQERHRRESRSSSVGSHSSSGKLKAQHCGEDPMAGRPGPAYIT